MVKPWELILHHAYSGVPGVIFDQSPKRSSHGVAVNLGPNAFHEDGATPGSGAVTFPRDGYIQVPTSPDAWAPLGGIRVEIICRCETVDGGGTLIDGGSFSFAVGGGFFSGDYAADPGGGVFNSGGSPGLHGPVPDNEWVTLGFLYDGFAIVDCTVNGSSELTNPDAYNALNTTTMVVIGNNRAGTNGFTGSIDDIKVWRRNPNYIDDVFINRPVDEDVEKCWVDWVRRLNDVLNADPACANQITTLMGRAILSILRTPPGDAATAAQWQAAAQRYAELWSQNRLDEIVPVLIDLLAWLRSHGLDPAQNADMQALLNSDCLAKLRNAIPPLTCDPKFAGFIDSLSESIQAL
jgi:hypothetical protein